MSWILAKRKEEHPPSTEILFGVNLVVKKLEKTS